MMQPHIRAALESHINGLAQDRGLKKVWEGVDFEAGIDQSYLHVFVMPATSDSNDLAGYHRVYRGVLQVNVTVPSGDGMGEIERLAGRVIAHCPKSLRLPAADGFVQLTSVMSMGPKMLGDGNVTLPLTSYYRMDTI